MPANADYPKFEDRKIFLVRGATLNTIVTLGKRSRPRATGDGGISIDQETDDGTFMSSKAECCDQPDCPTVALLCKSVASSTPTIVCDSISASKSKCGFSEFGTASSPPKKYIQKQWNLSVSFTCTNAPTTPNRVDNYSVNWSATTIYDSVTCVSDGTCSGSISRHGEVEDYSGIRDLTSDCSASLSSSCVWSGTTTYTYTDPPESTNSSTETCNLTIGSGAPGPSPGCFSSSNFVVDSSTTGHFSCPGVSCGYPGGGSYSGASTQELLDEYTTALLISNTEDALPAYDEDYNDTCSATRNLSSTESSYTISRFKHKFTFSGAVTGTITWNEHFVPEGGGAATDTPRTTTITSATASAVFEVMEPDTDGTTTLTDVRFIPSYRADFGCAGTFGSGQGCLCSAFRSATAVRRFKHKFRFTASASCRLRILWNETFRPTLTGAITYNTVSYAIGAEDPRPSNWTKTAKTYTKNFTGDPCGPENPDGVPTNPTGAITDFDSSVFTLDEPATNGTTYITDIRWSIINPDDSAPTPTEYEPTANSPEGISSFATTTGFNYACGPGPTCTEVTAAQPNCFPPE